MPALGALRNGSIRNSIFPMMRIPKQAEDARPMHGREYFYLQGRSSYPGAPWAQGKAVSPTGCESGGLALRCAVYLVALGRP